MNMNQPKRIGAILFLCICLAVSQAATAATIGVTPVSVNQSIGNTFSLDITISDVIDLYAFEFDIAFDPSILSANSIAEGSFLPPGGSTFFVPGGIDNGTGLITFTADSLIGPIPGVGGNGILASIDFTAIGIGTSGVSLTNITLLDSFGDDIIYQISDGSITVERSTTPNPVPEPSTLTMIGIGIVCLSGMRRRKLKA